MGNELRPPVVDPNKCTGYGLCHDHASRFLEMDDDGITHVRPGVHSLPPEARPAIQAAIDACPAVAIRWSDGGD